MLVLGIDGGIASVGWAVLELGRKAVQSWGPACAPSMRQRRIRSESRPTRFGDSIAVNAG